MIRYMLVCVPFRAHSARAEQTTTFVVWVVEVARCHALTLFLHVSMHDTQLLPYADMRLPLLHSPVLQAVPTKPYKRLVCITKLLLAECGVPWPTRLSTFVRHV